MILALLAPSAHAIQLVPIQSFEGDRGATDLAWGLGVVGDTNGDGLDDLTINSYGSHVGLYLGAPRGPSLDRAATFWDAEGCTICDTAWFVAHGDIDGDGYEDAALTTSGPADGHRVELRYGAPERPSGTSMVTASPMPCSATDAGQPCFTAPRAERPAPRCSRTPPRSSACTAW